MSKFCIFNLLKDIKKLFNSKQNNITNQNFTIISSAEEKILKWSNKEEIPIYKIDYVATFEEWDDSIEIYIFYNNNKEIKRCKNDGTTKKIKIKYISILKQLNYPFDEFSVDFIFDSHENVLKKYEGSYFYRLR